ncbi:hypothetical protein A8M77_14330 [Variovorax sp. JS1663]|nr:hypothetical protein A8M77_14330 [Variovorax sp. JS1663]
MSMGKDTPAPQQSATLTALPRGQWLQPNARRLVWVHGSQPRVSPQVFGEFFELIRVHGPPALLQAMRAGGDPDFCGDGFHALYCTFIQ